MARQLRRRNPGAKEARAQKTRLKAEIEAKGKRQFTRSGRVSFTSADRKNADDSPRSQRAARSSRAAAVNARRTAAASSSDNESSSRGSDESDSESGSEESDSSDAEEEQPQKTPSRGRNAPRTTSSATKSPSTRVRRSRRAIEPESESDSQSSTGSDEESEPEPPSKARRSRTTTESSTQTKPSRKAPRGKANGQTVSETGPAKAPRRSSRKPIEVSSESEEDDDDDDEDDDSVGPASNGKATNGWKSNGGSRQSIGRKASGRPTQTSSDSESSEAESDDENADDESVEDEDGTVDSESQDESEKHPVSRYKSRGKADPRAAYYFVEQLDIKKTRKVEMLTRFRYLLGLGDLFREFVDYRAEKDPEFRDILDQAMRENRRAAKGLAIRSAAKKKSAIFRSNPATDVAEVEDMLDDDEKITVFDESPGFVTGKLRQYQIDGLNWLISLFTNDINGILADEMGLGKTFQTIAFLAYLRSIQNINGPHLVIAPKSTIQNWAREFATWTPDMEVLVISGDKYERADILKNRLMTAKFDVCITSYELLIREKSFLKRIAWQYIIVDEAHRLKNEESILSKLMRVLYSRHRLLITGTPLQNNLHELWALLNFLLPDVFSDAEVFDKWFAEEAAEDEDAEEDAEAEDQEKSSSEKSDTERDDGQVIDRLRSLLSPFLLRRVKRDVEHSLLPKKEINLYVPMTEMQIDWYQRLLEKDLDAINTSGKGGSEKRMRLLNIVMQLRKCCNHPYLFEGAEPGPPFTTDEHLVDNSGKMILLDKLLKKLKAQGSRVLIFSQMSRMLDILEDFCNLRDYEYCRIDGGTQHEDRITAIDEYNRPGSDKFVFLLTTRAGGLGINLTTADQVIIYDSDWNPQADLQAMDRAHRIGQTKQVFVYRLIVEHAIEEKVLERAAHKLRLDQLVIQQGSNRNSAQEKAKAAASKEELADMIRHGAQEVFDKKDSHSLAEMSIDDLIASGEKRTEELNEKYTTLGLDELIKLTFDKPPSNQAPLVSKNHKEGSADDEIRHHRRARNTAMFVEEAISHSHSVRAPKQTALNDFQFYPPELKTLQARELAWYRRASGISLSPEDYSEDEVDESASVNAEIAKATPLTEEELDLKEKLISEGFSSWTRRDLFHFFHLLVEFGGHENMDEAAVEKMCAQWPEKDEDELKRYFYTFKARHNEISDIYRYNHMLEEELGKQRKQNERTHVLKQRVEAKVAPLSNMRIAQPTGGSASKHRFTELNDRFLLLQMYRIGLNDPEMAEKICASIRSSDLFQFDYYFKSRSHIEIGRRCASLLNVLAKENSRLPVKRSRRSAGPATPAAEDTQAEDPKRAKTSK